MRGPVKFSFFAPFLAICLFIMSCKGGRGPAGPAGAGGPVLAVFRQGASPSIYYTGESDTYISSGSAYIGLNYGAAVSASVGPYAGGFGTRRMLIKFDISGQIPPDVVITGASMQLYYALTAGSNTLTAYSVTRPWIEGAGNGQATAGAAWNTDGSNPWTGGAYGGPAGSPVFCSDAGLNSYVRFPLDTAVVQAWADDPAGNNGLIIIASNEDASTTDTITFSTKEYGSDQGPILNIYYEPE